MDLNLSRPTLGGQLELTKTGNSLRWPLDITTMPERQTAVHRTRPTSAGASPIRSLQRSKRAVWYPRISFEQRNKKNLRCPPT